MTGTGSAFCECRLLLLRERRAPDSPYFLKKVFAPQGRYVPITGVQSGDDCSYAQSSPKAGEAMALLSWFISMCRLGQSAFYVHVSPQRDCPGEMALLPLICHAVLVQGTKQGHISSNVQLGFKLLPEQINRNQDFPGVSPYTYS